jgi:hypothetical protein
VPVPERVDGDPGEQVEVAPAVDVPDVAPSPRVEHELGAAEDAEQAAGVAVEPLSAPWALPAA